MSCEAEKNTIATAQIVTGSSDCAGFCKASAAIMRRCASCVTQDPAAAPAEKRQRVAIEQRRPQELQQVGDRDIGKDADRGVADSPNP